MSNAGTPPTVFPDSKTHYEILDALRGIAAVTVVFFHLFETFTNSNHLVQIINHGYLAVDFFYVLSGFVIGYAYDSRWGAMGLREFFRRRLIRLHPMIIMGMVVGAVAFYFGDFPDLFPGIHDTPIWKLLLVMLIGCTLWPVTASLDIRGWSEMYPLNGPAWSLFYEYAANILYALVVRRLSNTALAVLVFLAGCALIQYATSSPTGDLVGGWALEPAQLRIGITRLMYPFFAGLLLYRIVRPGRLNKAFLWSALLVLTVLAFPRIGGSEALWMNGLYDSLAVVLVFPLIVYIGASGEIRGRFAQKISRFLGDISYPLYITHYPLIYVYTGWVVQHKLSLAEAWPMGLLVFFLSLSIAYASLKCYDLPLRKWLAKRFVH